MISHNPCKNGTWVMGNNSVYERNSEFYQSGGRIFDPMLHYEGMFNKS
jgi:hypothetical protein